MMSRIMSQYLSRSSKFFKLNQQRPKSLFSISKTSPVSATTASISNPTNDKFFSSVNLNEVKKEFRELPGGKVSITKDEDNGVAYICLEHAEKKNGFSGSMMVDLHNIVASLETWESGKAVILHGKGDIFCSGGYHDTVKKIFNPKDGYKMSSLMQDSVIRLAKLPLVSVTVVQGQAIGGGAELMLSTDFRLFTPSANCRFVEAKMGVGTGWGGGTLLRRLLGSPKALELLLTCRKVSAEDAITIGLADGLVSEDNSVDDALKWITGLIGAHDSSIVRAVKQIVACDNFDEEKRIFSNTWGGLAQEKALNSNIKHKG